MLWDSMHKWCAFEHILILIWSAAQFVSVILWLSFKQQIHASSEPSVTIDWNDAISNNENTKLIATNPQAPATGKNPLYFFLQLKYCTTL